LIAAGAAGLQPLAQQAMYREVGIAANGRREMAIRVAGQSVVAFLLRTVGRLLEAAQQGVVDRVRIRTVHGLLQHALQGKAIDMAFHLVTETAGEIGEGLELDRFRGRVDAAEKGYPQARQM